MIEHNELIIDGIATSSFPFKIIVHTAPSVQFNTSKTNLIEHNGISGALTVTNKKRALIKKNYTIYLVRPTETQLFEFLALLSRENFWLESEAMQLVKYFVYKVDTFESIRDAFGVYTLDVSFICHPTKFFKEEDSQIFTENGVLQLKGTALAHPTLIIKGNSTGETIVTIGTQSIRLKQLDERVTIVSDPKQARVLDKQNRENFVDWSGDFICLETNKSDKTIGVALGSGIRELEIKTLWGYV